MTERFGPALDIRMVQETPDVLATALARVGEGAPPAVRPGGAVHAPASTKSVAPKRTPRRFLLPLILIAALGYGAHLAYDWFVEGRFLVTTDDAYVGADTAIIAAKVSGHVTEVAVAQNASVHAGDLLVRIDDGDYKLAVDAAKAKIDTQDATIGRIAQQVEAQKTVIAQTQAQIGSMKAQRESAAADRQRAALEYERSQKLAQGGFGSQQRLEQATADNARTSAAITSADASEASAEAAFAGAKANLDVLQSQKLEAERVRAELVTAKDKAERDLSFTQIRAPFDGVVGNKAVELGQYVQPGVRLLALVAMDSVYVDANFKETQLASIRPGEKVDVSVDALGGRVVPGVVTSISPASGAQFSLLPPDNATGNFTKVVQRVPVRITFAPEAIRDGELRPGLSVVASVRTRDESLPRPTLLGALGLGLPARESAKP
jgi:membrane fusion protein (multidrug efflux system)